MESDYLSRIREMAAAGNTAFHVIAVPIALVRYCGGNCKHAVFLAQLMYWTLRSKRNGWVYKSYCDWEEETGLTLKVVRRAADWAADEMGILERKVRKARGAPTVHYRLIPEKFWHSFQTKLSLQSWNPIPEGQMNLS